MNVKNVIKQVQTHYKAVVSALGGLLGYLYMIEMSNPNHWVALAIVVLTALGVHQIPNKGV